MDKPIQELRALHENRTVETYEDWLLAVTAALPALLDVAEWIAKNAEHRLDCRALEKIKGGTEEYRRRKAAGETWPCTCGLDAALQSLGEPDA